MFIPLVISIALSVQPDSVRFEHQASIEVAADHFTSDNVGNIYVVTGETITSYDQYGEELRIYSDKVLGDIFTVDAMWALKPIAYYQEAGFVVFLDNTLSAQGEPLNLAEHDLQTASVMCTSYNNGLWFYDPLDYRLVKTDQNLNVQLETEYLNQLISPDIDPIAMLEKDNRLYVVDSILGIMMFDQFGSYYTTLPIVGVTKIWVRKKSLYYVVNGTLGRYDLISKEHTAITIPSIDSPIIRVRAENDLLMLQTPESIEVYRIR